MEQGPLNLSYRDWFIISLLVLVNLIIFGCVWLAVTERVYFG